MKPFAELTATQKTVELVRWVCVAPAAWLGALAPRLLYRVIVPPAMAQLPGTPREMPSDFQRLVPFLFNVLMTAAFVIAGSKMAPRGRFVTAMVLAALWIAYSFLIHVFVHLGRGRPNWGHFIIAALAAIVAAAYIFSSERSRRGATTAGVSGDDHAGN